MSTQPPPRPEDELEATVAMPRVEAPPPPQRRRIDPAVVEPSGPVHVSPSAPPGQPVTGTHIPPGAPDPVPPGQAVRPRFEFGNPFGYVCARLFAFLLDVGLVSVVVTSLAYSLIAINPITGLPTNTQGGFDATFALGLAVALVYIWIAEASFGTTIGKLVTGLHVYVLRGGGAVGLGRAFVRGLLRPVDLLIVGGVLALLPGRRRLGDLAGGTIVAHSPLRGFAPVLGWIVALILAGVPVVLTGFGKTMLSLLAFYQFLPGIVTHIVALAHDALRFAHLVS
ncbi:MAG TPA: RDD family protein [Candidatus Limnocylindrales bacterium]|nr:RDD family protein [Candidatus Limnocylindrales bacterium]